MDDIENYKNQPNYYKQALDKLIKCCSEGEGFYNPDSDEAQREADEIDSKLYR